MAGETIGKRYLLALGLVGCTPSPTGHCEARQRLWERAFPDELSGPQARQIFVDGCSRELSGPGKIDELRCRDACLGMTTQDAPAGSQTARDAYGAFTSCEAECLGAKPDPVRAE